MASYYIHLLLASLHIEDTPISYKPPRGPTVNFRVAYNQREANQPANFDYSNFGPKWTFNWLSYVTDDPINTSASASVYIRGGGTEVFTNFDSGTQSYAADKQSLAVLVRTSGASYERRFADGSKEVFALSDGSGSYPRRIFLTSLIDPSGNAVTLTYDSGFRLVTLSDALGQVTTISYENTADSLKITKVTDPFGRYAIFGYTAGELSSITDPAGIQSQFSYASGSDFINALTTPYGTTTFAKGENGNAVRWLEATDPLGGKERVEYNNAANGVPAADPSPPGGVQNAFLNSANTFYWDKKATELYPPVNGVYDYTKARVVHWLQFSDRSTISGIKHSEKNPLEGRLWYTYAGQPDGGTVGQTALTATIARILDDRTTQAWQYQYNSIGKVTKVIDPLNRVTTYNYAGNNIDLLGVYQQNPAGVSTNPSDPSNAPADLIASYAYDPSDPPHLPRTYTDAAGEITTYNYRTTGQIQSVVNARNETTSYSYGNGSPGQPLDYLVSIIIPTFNNANAVTGLTYDSANRVRTVTNTPDNYSVTTDYDAIDRPTTVTYNDTPQTTQQFDYRKYQNGTLVTPQVTTLDVGASKDRRGRWTYREYDGNRHLTKIKEHVSDSPSVDRVTQYNWCTCGSLASIIDPLGHTTTFNRDLQSRVYQKVFDDGSSINYLREGQSGPNTIGTTSRLKSMTDARNQRANYQYLPDDNLKQVSYTDTNGQPLNPATPTVNFTYEPSYNRVATMADGTGATSYAYHPVGENGANQLSTVTGPLTNSTITYDYDALGRVETRSINGVASKTPYDSLGRPDTTDNPLGHFTRLYEFDVTPRLTNLTYPTGQTSKYMYFDNSQDRRLRTLQDLTSGSANISKFDYIYDAEGEIYPTWTKQLNTSPPTTSNLTYDLVDELTDVTNTTPGNPSTSFSYRYDLAGNRKSDIATSYSLNDVNEITNTGYSYDANGNLTSDGVNTYQWDAANRLTTIVYPANAGWTELTYDGLGRRVKLVEKDGTGAVQRTSNFIWAGMTMAEERTSDNTVIKRFFPQGVQFPTGSSPNTKLFYSKDHLGSIRGLTNENGTIIGVLDYDAYGSVSRAPVPANDTSGTVPVLTTAVSRLVHGTAGIFDLNLPLTGAPGIEMRSPANNTGNYTLVLTFDRPVVAATSARVASGMASVNGTPVFVGNTAIVLLSGVADRQTITLELDNVMGVTGTAAKVFVAMSVCIGDVNQSGSVTIDDVNLIRAHTLQTVDGTTFKYDVNASGRIDAADVSAGRQDTGSSLFPDFAFTGHYYHARSGLYLAAYRAYNPSIGRWLSRDPLQNAETRQGPNLYAYVGNDPIGRVDLLGLSSYLLTFGHAWDEIGHTAIWVVDAQGSTFYSFDSAGLHRYDNPSSFLSEQVVAHQFGTIDLLNPSRVNDEELRNFYDTLIAQQVKYGPGGVCSSQAREAIQAATADSDEPYQPTDIGGTPPGLLQDLSNQGLIDLETEKRVGTPRQRLF